MPGCKRLVPAAGFRGDALRTFVDGEEAAHAVASAMGVIEPASHRDWRAQHVELRAAVPCGKARSRERDVALQHAGEAVAHLGGRLADRPPCG